MSADNGVYISQWRDGYRVAHFTNVDAVEEYPATHPVGAALRWQRFKDSPVLVTRKEAYKVAEDIESSLSVCEYGIMWIGHDDYDPPSFPDLDQESADEIIETYYKNLGSLALPDSAGALMPSSVYLGECLGCRIREDGKHIQFDLLVHDDGVWNSCHTFSSTWLEELIDNLQKMQITLHERYSKGLHGYDKV